MLQCYGVIFCTKGKDDLCEWRFCISRKKKLMTQTPVAGNIFKELQVSKVFKPVVAFIVFFWLLPGSDAQVPEGPDTITASSGGLLLKGLLWRLLVQKFCQL
jgi:hypothetical protein